MICPTSDPYRRGSKISRPGPPRSRSSWPRPTCKATGSKRSSLGCRPIGRGGAVLDYHVTRGRPSESAVWQALQGIWDDTGVRLGAVDAGYLPQAVKALANRDTRCLPIRGMAGVRQAIGTPTGAQWCCTAGVDGLKRDLLGKVDSGWLRLPAAPWCTRSWLLGLTAEHEEVIERSGRRVTAWKQHYARNEPLDCAVYALAIAELVPRPRRRRPRLVRV